MMNEKEYTLDESLFNEKQLREIKAGMKQGLNVSIFTKPEFNCDQMSQIYNKG